MTGQPRQNNQPDQHLKLLFQLQKPKASSSFWAAEKDNGDWEDDSGYWGEWCETEVGVMVGLLLLLLSLSLLELLTVLVNNMYVVNITKYWLKWC